MPEDVLDWNSLGQTRVGEVEPPKGIPDGHYSAIITGPGKVDNVGQKKTLCITFPIRLNQPMNDVDAELFAASDGFAKNGYELPFYLTPASLYRFTEFGKAMGASEDMTVQEMAEFLSTCGEEFVLTARQEQSRKDPKRTYLQLDDPIPLSQFEQQG